MKKKLMKKTALALAFAAVLSLAGCGQSEEAASSAAPESSSTEPVTVPNSSEDGGDVSSAEAEAEGEETAASEDSDESSNASEAAAPEPSPPEGSVPDSSVSEASTPDTPEPNASEPAASEGSVPDSSSSEASTPDTPEPTASESAAPEQVSGEGQAVSGEQALSGTDLNVQFGDGSTSFALHLYDNETADAIARHVGTADWRLPIYHYDDYDNWEVMQYYDIPSRYEIPSNPQNVTSAKSGEVYYSEPNRIILFYGDAEISSEYTPVGYIDATQDFVDAVESNPVLEGWGNKIVNISR